MELKEFLEAWAGAPEGLTLKYDTQGGARPFRTDMETEDGCVTAVWPRVWLLKKEWIEHPVEVTIREIKLVTSYDEVVQLNKHLYIWGTEKLIYASEWKAYDDSHVADYFWSVCFENEDEGAYVYGVETTWPLEEALVKVLDALKVNPDLTASEVASLLGK